MYGLVGLKTHTKTALVVREEADGIRRYCHIGTGNYNPTTARIYEDLGLLTVDPELGDDLTQLFNYLTGYAREFEYNRLLVAPHALRPAFSQPDPRRGRATAPSGRIIMKINTLVDPDMIDALYDASQAGVEIDLIVRGICCLRPGVPGLSETIRVRSIVGRYLEHSRIYYFEHGSGLGHRARLPHRVGRPHAERNLDRRVEALGARARPRPCRSGWRRSSTSTWPTPSWPATLDADGNWRRVGPDP